MLKRFQVTNFKNFKDPITIDFTKIAGYQFNSECISDHLLGKMMIYGKNSTGKTNLGRALMDIRYILLDYYFFPSNDDSFLNADSKSRLSKFSYTFSFFGHDINYVYQRNKNRTLHDESLLFDGSKIFYCNFDTHETQFRNLGLLNLQTLNTQLYVEILNSTFDSDESTQVPPFLRWLIANTALPSNSPLLELRNFVDRMHLVSTNRIPTYIERRKFPDLFYDRLSDPGQLQDFQDFLNTMGVPCKLVCKKKPDGKYELYFKHNVLIPFIENASSGTLAIADLYGRLQFGRSCSVLFMDEFDAFYHYEMSQKVVTFIKAKYPQCQVIFTTHNTNLMSNELLRPDCLFILSTQGSLTSLCDATSRELREGHNLEKMYISGEFSNYE